MAPNIPSAERPGLAEDTHTSGPGEFERLERHLPDPLQVTIDLIEYSLLAVED